MAHRRMFYAFINVSLVMEWRRLKRRHTPYIMLCCQHIVAGGCRLLHTPTLRRLTLGYGGVLTATTSTC